LPALELIYHTLTLKKQNYNIHYYDFQAEPEKINDLFKIMPKSGKILVLVLVTNPTLNTDLLFIKKIKEVNKETLIFVKFDVKSEETIRQILKSGLVETVLVGETENSIHKIFEESAKEGTAYLENEAVIFGPSLIIKNMDELLDLELDFLNLAKYKYPLLPTKKGNFFSFQSSRGCPFPCAYYCPYPLTQGNIWRSMSEKKLYVNIELLVKKYNIGAILFRDATFTLDKKRVNDFCGDILVKNLKFKWWCETRMNCLDEELLKEMSKAGCVGINLGVETGDDALMRKQGKIGGDINQLIKIRSLSSKYKIQLHFLMIVGLPEETKKSLYKSFLIIEKLKPESLGVTTITPYPGTPLYHDAIKNNWIIDKNLVNYIGNKVVMKSKYLSPRQIKHGNFLLRLAGYLNKQRHPFYALMNKFLKIYFFLWSKI